MLISAYKELRGHHARGQRHDQTNGTLVNGTESQIYATSSAFPSFGSLLACSGSVTQYVDGTTKRVKVLMGGHLEVLTGKQLHRVLAIKDWNATTSLIS
jgi:hypothetical protein